MTWNNKIVAVILIFALCFAGPFLNVFLGESNTTRPAEAQVIVSTSFGVGQKVEVYGTQPSSTLKVRETWGTSTNIAIYGEKYWGSTGTVIDGPQYANGYVWWKVQWDNTENVSNSYYKPQPGWSAQDYLWSYDTDTRVRGVDVSHSNTITNWQAIKNSGRDFVFIKTTEGTNYQDPGLATNILDASSTNPKLLVGLYHFGRPDLNPTSAGSEADWFYEKAKNYLVAGQYLVPALDLERTTGDFQSLALWVHAWMIEFQKKANLTSYPLLYCSKSYAQGLYSQDSTMTKYPLWVVDFANSYSPTTSGWSSSWAFRQYAGDIGVVGTAGRCPGFKEDTGVDLDIYNGNINSLKSKLLIQTATNQPSMPVLLQPSNTLTGVSRTPTFQWSASSGTAPITYTLQISTSSTFSSMVVNQPGLSATSYLLPSSLNYSTPYYWRVQAINSYGNSPISLGFSFTTVASGTAPSMPVLLQPSNTLTGVSRTPTFQWSASSGTAPITYTLQISTSSTFSSMVVNQPGLSATSYLLPSSLNYSTPYYWRVQAINSYGNSPISLGFSFTTVAAAAGVTVTGVSPSPVHGRTGLQYVAVFGTGFTASSTVCVGGPIGPWSKTLLTSQVTFVSSTSLLMNINTTAVAQPWWVQVLTGTNASNQFPFQVVVP